MVSLADIILAEHRLRPHLRPSPLEAGPQIGENVWLKLENVNETHSFKIRGALNAILSLGEGARERGIIAASSGNHAGAVAYAGRLAGVHARILMPKSTPKKKVDKARYYGAEAILFGDTYDQAEAEALRRARDGGTWISPYNDARVIAGAGTIGLELIAQLPGIERVLVPVSGGGLIAGLATAVKHLKPEVEVIGVNAVSAPAMFNCLKGCDRPQEWETLADALSGDIEAGSMTVAICRRYVDEMVLVSEEQIAGAMRLLIEGCGWVVEGGGAVAVAALLGDEGLRDGRATVAVVSGGNVDGDVLRRVLAWRG